MMINKSNVIHALRTLKAEFPNDTDGLNPSAKHWVGDDLWQVARIQSKFWWAGMGQHKTGRRATMQEALNDLYARLTAHPQGGYMVETNSGVVRRRTPWCDEGNLVKIQSLVNENVAWDENDPVLEYLRYAQLMAPYHHSIAITLILSHHRAPQGVSVEAFSALLQAFASNEWCVELTTPIRTDAFRLFYKSGTGVYIDPTNIEEITLAEYDEIVDTYNFGVGLFPYYSEVV